MTQMDSNSESKHTSVKVHAMPGLDKLLRGVLKYRATMRPRMVKEFWRIKDNPEPKAVMLSCVDSRVMMTRLLQCDVGDMLLVRNAGNLMPHSKTHCYTGVTTVPGALELGCITNNIRHVIVCGHSDCKAMNALFAMRDDTSCEGSPLQLWLKRHGAATVAKYKELQEAGGVGPICFEAETPSKAFHALIDPEDNFAQVDKFSQVNTLQQLQNISSYEFLHNKLANDEVRLSAMWFDVYTGDFYMFSREQRRFIEVSETTYDHLVVDAESWGTGDDTTPRPGGTIFQSNL